MADIGYKTVQLADITTWFAAMNVANGTKELITGGFKIISTGGDTYIGEAFKSPSTWSVSRQAQSIEVESETTYTISTTGFPKCYISYGDSSYNTLNSAFIRIPNRTSYTFTTPENCKYIIFRMGDELSSGQEVQFPNIMLNKGNQPLPYQPYSSTGWYHSLKKFDGAAWQDASVKEWDGSQWQ